MKLPDNQLKDILLSSGSLSEDVFELAQKSAKTDGVELSQYLVANGLIKDAQLGQLIANHLKIPFISLNHISIPEDVLHLLPELVARKQKAIVYRVDGKKVYIATSRPKNLQLIDFLKKRFGDNVIINYATGFDIKESLGLYAKDATKAFEDILSENIQQAKTAGSSKHAVELPIIRIVETIIEYAYRNKASDVHLEPEETYSLLRFRIDGILHDIVRLPKKIHDQMITRIKVLSNLRTDEHNAPQDGKIEQKIDEELLNLRVSIVPVVGGEKVVLRLLSDQAKMLSLSDLGFFDTSLEKITKAYEKPYGMILTTGPTGSGKTTTLYSILKLLNKREVNIMTIEDPVEYSLSGISQIQINTKTDLTFVSGLRSIVRQDPDIILVGEIRDQETAKIAVNAAMTGHLVLSTLHTNDAATTIPRLFDMGVEPFLAASSINVIVGQRLVRKICENCRTSMELKAEKFTEYTKTLSPELIKAHFGNDKSVRVYYGKGCEICHHTGYTGRVGVYEVLEVDDEIREMIVQRANSDQISEFAVKKGMVPMIGDGLEKVKIGVTTIDEVIRVTKE